MRCSFSRGATSSPRYKTDTLTHAQTKDMETRSDQKHESQQRDYRSQVFLFLIERVAMSECEMSVRSVSALGASIVIPHTCKTGIQL